MPPSNGDKGSAGGDEVLLPMIFVAKGDGSTSQGYLRLENSLNVLLRCEKAVC